MDSNQKKRLIIIIQVLLGVLIAAAVTIIIFSSHSSTNGQNQCVATKKRPILSLDSWQNVRSQDNKTLINFAGYLELPGGSTYLALDVYNVSTNSGPRGRQELKLMTKCGNLLMGLNRDSPIVEVESIQVEPAIGRACQVNATGIYYGQDQSYACYSRQELECGGPGDKGEGAARLVVEALRFEVNGDPRQIAAGNFSKPSRFCF